MRRKRGNAYPRFFIIDTEIGRFGTDLDGKTADRPITEKEKRNGTGNRTDWIGEDNHPI